jgi:uncharacterized SAM-binding protein YcdF (DUF218 family)
MGQYSEKAKPWLLSIIRQRKLLMVNNRSHIPQLEAELAMHSLEVQLNAYPYDHDVYMARFVRQHVHDIATILPGAGSSCHEKQKQKFDEIRKEAILIEDKFTKTVSNVIKVRGL